MADEKEKKTTTAKAPAKTVRRVRKTAQKAETVQKKPEVQKEERRMSQEALGMVETRGLVASIEAADSMLKDVYNRQVRYNIRYRWYSAYTANHARSSYRSWMCSDR